MSTDLTRCPLRAPGVEWQCDLLAGHLEDHRTEMAGRFVCWDTSPEDVLAAYRAGREDAAREVIAYTFVDASSGSTVFLHPSEVTIVRSAVELGRFKESADLARGPGVQPTEEQRAQEEDQKRGEEKVRLAALRALGIALVRYGYVPEDDLPGLPLADALIEALATRGHMIVAIDEEGRS